jgi:uncharacterized membrane protein YkoI
MTRYLTALTLVAALLAGPALLMPTAQAGTDPLCEMDEAKEAGDLSGILKKLEAQGYRAIEEIEREGGCYEVETKDAAGQEVELLVHAVTGEILKIEQDD